MERRVMWTVVAAVGVLAVFLAVCYFVANRFHGRRSGPSPFPVPERAVAGPEEVAWLRASRVGPVVGWMDGQAGVVDVEADILNHRFVVPGYSAQDVQAGRVHVVGVYLILCRSSVQGYMLCSCNLANPGKPAQTALDIMTTVISTDVATAEDLFIAATRAAVYRVPASLATPPARTPLTHTDEDLLLLAAFMSPDGAVVGSLCETYLVARDQSGNTLWRHTWGATESAEPHEVQPAWPVKIVFLDGEDGHSRYEAVDMRTGKVVWEVGDRGWQALCGISQDATLQAWFEDAATYLTNLPGGTKVFMEGLDTRHEVVFSLDGSTAYCLPALEVTDEREDTYTLSRQSQVLRVIDCASGTLRQTIDLTALRSE